MSGSPLQTLLCLQKRTLCSSHFDDQNDEELQTGVFHQRSWMKEISGIEGIGTILLNQCSKCARSPVFCQEARSSYCCLKQCIVIFFQECCILGKDLIYYISAQALPFPSLL